MNREIKFRAWDNKDKVWLMGYEYPNLGGFSMFGECMLFQQWSEVLNDFILQQRDKKSQDLILMQFTGLSDKDGKEIYEGDLLQHPHDGYEPRIIMKVVFNEGCFCYTPVSDKKELEILPALRTINKNYQIIGNIYEK